MSGDQSRMIRQIVGHRRISKSMLYAQVYAIFMYTPPPPERLEILEKKVFFVTEL